MLSLSRQGSSPCRMGFSYVNRFRHGGAWILPLKHRLRVLAILRVGEALLCLGLSSDSLLSMPALMVRQSAHKAIGIDHRRRKGGGYVPYQRGDSSQAEASFTRGRAR